MANMREDSAKNWASDTGIQDINGGSLQRIADATEIMAKSYVALIEDRKRYERWYLEERERRHKRDRQIAAFKGVITKLRKRA